MDNPKHDLLQIGDLADRAGVTTRAIRYYEELGIVEPEERTTGGFRLYSQAQLRSLQIVQSLKTLGFGLEHIRRIFNLMCDLPILTGLTLFWTKLKTEEVW